LLEELDKQPLAKSPLERRIAELECLLACPVLGEHAENAAAVSEGYKSGTLEYISGQYPLQRREEGSGPETIGTIRPQGGIVEEFPVSRGIWIESVQKQPALHPHFSTRRMW
jgi:hypothetical protein